IGGKKSPPDLTRHGTRPSSTILSNWKGKVLSLRRWPASKHYWQRTEKALAARWYLQRPLPVSQHPAAILLQRYDSRIAKQSEHPRPIATFNRHLDQATGIGEGRRQPLLLSRMLGERHLFVVVVHQTRSQQCRRENDFQSATQYLVVNQDIEESQPRHHQSKHGCGF